MDATKPAPTVEADDLPTRAKPTAAAMLKALRSEDSAVRGRAVRRLAEMEPEAEAIVSAIVGDMRSQDYDVRSRAADVVPRIGEAAVPFLIESLGPRGDSRAWVRAEAARTLSRIGPKARAKDAAEALIGNLWRSDYYVREEAEKGLAVIGSAAVPALIEVLRDDNLSGHYPVGDNFARMRSAAIRVLGNIGPAAKEAVPTIREAMEENGNRLEINPKTALEAIEKIEQSGTATPVPSAEHGDITKQPMSAETAEMADSGWSKPVNGLRARLVCDKKTFVLGRPMEVTLELECFGEKDYDFPEKPLRRCQLFPHIDVHAKHVDGVKSAPRTPLNIPNRLAIVKGRPFRRSLDLPKLLKIDHPGKYVISGGHSNGLVTDIGDWTGKVLSPPLVLTVVAANPSAPKAQPDTSEPGKAVDDASKAPPATQPGQPVKGLKVSVWTDKKEFTLDEPILVHWQIENVGTSDREILRREWRSEPAFFEIETPGAKKIEYGNSSRFNAGLRGSLRRNVQPEKTVLQAGGVLKADRDLRAFFRRGYCDPGAYGVTGLYYPITGYTQEKFLTTDEFKDVIVDRIASAPIQIKIVSTSKQPTEDLSGLRKGMTRTSVYEHLGEPNTSFAGRTRVAYSRKDGPDGAPRWLILTFDQRVGEGDYYTAKLLSWKIVPRAISTPPHLSADARKGFIDGYHSGYLHGLHGESNTSPDVTRTPVEVRAAFSKGFYTGQYHGLLEEGGVEQGKAIDGTRAEFIAKAEVRARDADLAQRLHGLESSKRVTASGKIAWLVTFYRLEPGENPSYMGFPPGNTLESRAHPVVVADDGTWVISDPKQVAKYRPVTQPKEAEPSGTPPPPLEPPAVTNFKLILRFRSAAGMRPDKFPTIEFSTEPMLPKIYPAGYCFVQITLPQATKLTAHLKQTGFFNRRERDPKKETAPSYSMSCSGSLGSHYEHLGWGEPLIKRLTGLRKVLDKEAAKPIDRLLDDLAKTQ